MRWSRRTWYEGSHPEGFAKAAHMAIEDAEKKLPKPWPKEYDVKLRVVADGVLSDYKVLISPNT